MNGAQGFRGSDSDTVPSFIEDPANNLPNIGVKDPFVKVVKALSVYMVEELVLPATFEQLRTTSSGNNVRILVDHLVANVRNPALINALLTLKWHFSTLEHDDRGINETRANACEITAWRFLSRISERDAVDFCLYELPEVKVEEEAQYEPEPSERSSLLPQFRARDSLSPQKPGNKRVELLRSVSNIGEVIAPEDDEEDPTSSFTGLNGLEIAAVSDCKKFLSQRVVQKIVHGIWKGDITFWESLSEDTRKIPQFYDKSQCDHFARLRVPLYIKAFEVLFFASFLFLYYAVLVQRNQYKITPLEIVLYVWFLAFAYDEVGEFIDAGSIFYAVDIWNGCDLIIILIGAAFGITRILGIAKNDSIITDAAFDILSLEALFMVPRVCSLLSLHPYFGTLIPCLKEMTKDFVKFMVVVVVLYIGFLTTFTLLARDTFKLSEMSWILIKVFFGSSYLGFDIMKEINPALGPPLMLIFVTMTNILLITSLISILSDSFSKVIAHAREEYIFVYSVYVLEASTSNRLTHFYPPLNVIPLVFIRPLRLFLSAEQLRSTRIAVLKTTHLPFVAIIYVWERLNEHVQGGSSAFSGLIDPVSDSGRRGSNSTRRSKPFLSNRRLKTTSQHFPDCPDPDHAPTISFAGVVKGQKESANGNGNASRRENESGGSTEERLGTIHRELEDQVRDLNGKIAELTALIMAQQGAIGMSQSPA